MALAMRRLRLLAIDDDPLVLESIRLSLPESWEFIGQSTAQQLPACEAAIIDVHLKAGQKDAEGLSVMKNLSQRPQVDLIAMSGDLTRQTMENCLTAGASRFLSKPLSKTEIQLMLAKIEVWHDLRSASLRRPDKKYFWIGQSPESERVKKQLAFLKNEAGPILIEGETGTGKEVAARILNQMEGRPFVEVNMASLPSSLFESEIFGHQKGAFTGATSARIGLALAADQGDLFLDEIQSLSLENQAKLLRFLETGEVRPLGSDRLFQTRVRVIAASNKNLQIMVRDGQFREDLYWRLAKHKIELPALRQRTADIQELCDWFFSQKIDSRKELTPEALQILETYKWPGNVRELLRLCEQLQLVAPLPLIRPEDLGPLLGGVDTETFSVDLSLGLEQNLRNFERHLISDALNETEDVNVVADKLKISRSTLYKKIKELNIERSIP